MLRNTPGKRLSKDSGSRAWASHFADFTPPGLLNAPQTEVLPSVSAEGKEALRSQAACSGSQHEQEAVWTGGQATPLQLPSDNATRREPAASRSRSPDGCPLPEFALTPFQQHLGIADFPKSPHESRKTAKELWRHWCGWPLATPPHRASSSLLKASARSWLLCAGTWSPGGLCS